MEVNRKPLDSWAWPEGYPLYYICKDNGVLCPNCVNKEIDLIDQPTHDSNSWDYQWKVEMVDINEEDDSLYCDHCNKKN